jgi:hypothetical protein
MKLSRFLKELGRFVAVVFGNCHIQLVGSIGLSSCNRILRFFISLFVL